ncbi:hypothetical protein M3Y99_00216600 [Aphelenchoides fujianensis]|nr:hypothetical protein M3Y99_00216600 [Aphelenchoides fujianensis]
MLLSFLAFTFLTAAYSLEDGILRLNYTLHADLLLTINLLGGVSLEIGSPPQPLGARFHFAVVPLLVSSERCGRPARGCPLYCVDDGFAELYCRPLCFPLTPVNRGALCTRPFVATNSSTYTPLGGDWRVALRCCRHRFFGQFARDVVRFVEGLQDFELEFVEGLLMQASGFDSAPAIFGLGLEDTSGRPGVVRQLHARGAIRAPVLSFARYPTVLLGGLDRDSCGEWTRVPVVPQSGWTIRATVRLFGREFVDQTVTFSFDRGELVIPRSALRRLLATNVVWPRYCGGYVYPDWLCARSNAPQRVEFAVDSGVFASGVAHVVEGDKFCAWDARDRSFCPAAVVRSSLGAPAAAEEPWIVGVNQLVGVCWSFDWERREVSLANRIT